MPQNPNHPSIHLHIISDGIVRCDVMLYRGLCITASENSISY